MPALRGQASALSNRSLVQGNRYSCVLGVGVRPPRSRRGRQGFQALLTADIPGTAFAELTEDLRDKLMPKLDEKRAGRRRCLYDPPDDLKGSVA